MGVLNLKLELARHKRMKETLEDDLIILHHMDCSREAKNAIRTSISYHNMCIKELESELEELDNA